MKESNTPVSKKSLVVVSKTKNLPAIKTKQRENGEIVTLESFGIEAVLDGRQGMYSKIIPQASKLPISRTKRYYPITDYQDVVRVSCFKGEQAMAEKNHKLGEFNISGIEPTPKKESKGVDVTFSINRVGVILVDAVEVAHPDNHLKIKLEYFAPEGLLKGVTKGILREVGSMFLPSGKRK